MSEKDEQVEEAAPQDPGAAWGDMLRNPVTGTIWFWNTQRWVRGEGT